MQLTKLHSAILFSLLPITSTFAGGLDRSGQSIQSFLQQGNYAEAAITVIDPDVKGQAINQQNVSDMADDYYFPSAAIKVQATDKISLGLIYDQPFGADATYGLENPVFSQNRQGTQVEVKTENLTGLIGYQPTKNWNFYAGPVWQTVEADIALRGMAYKNSGYNIEIDKKEAWGWLAGAAYQIPEIALKASVTYRSEIDHDANVTETGFSALRAIPTATAAIDAIAAAPAEKLTITTPQSVNLDLQSGIMADTVAFANIRWVNWKDFSIRPDKFGQVSEVATAASGGNGFNLIDYTDDQWSVNAGVGRKVTDKWAGNVSVGWDSGAGNPVSTLGPTEGYWNLGVGVQYSPTPATFIAGGVKYFWLGDADANVSSGTVVGEFEDNNAIAYGLKMGYRF